MLRLYVAALGPFQKLATDVFRAVVDPNACRLAAPFDDLVQAPDDALCWEREVDIDCQAFAIEVIENVEKPESSPIANRSAIKSIDQLLFGASGTVSSSDFSRTRRLRGLMRRFSSSSR